MYLSAFITVITLLFVYACQKENNTATTDNTPFNENSVEKNAVVATATFDGLSDLAQAGFDSNTLKSLDLNLGSCPAIGLNFTQTPFTITLDWGTGCKNSDGITRSGKVTMTLSGMMNVVGSEATFKFVDFVSDGKKLSGVHRIKYLGPNSGNNWPKYSVFTEGKIEFADKSVITYRSEYVRLQSEGKGTASLLDDTWRMEGTSSGVNKDGTKWTAKTTKVLIKKGDCKWYNSGTLVITPEKGDVKTIDFGDGACNNRATLKVGDKTTEITLD